MDNNRNMRGFTLIEMSISMIIIALLTVPFFQIYTNYQTRQEIESTDNNVRRVSAFVHEFYTQNGFYPCPAKVNVPRSDASYGHSVDCSAGFATYDPVSLPAGSCTGDGICMEEAVGTPGIGRKSEIAEPHVIVGALPYRELQLDEDDSLDGYGARLLYAVTYSMTDRTTFDYTQGAVSILDEAGESRVNPEGSADFVVLSHGKTGEGAYTREGVLVSSCTGVALDIENCNIGFEGSATVSDDAVYISGLRSDAIGADKYDDVVEYFNQDVLSPWRRTDLDKENIEALASNDVQVGSMGAVSAKLHVATTGNLGVTAVPALRVSGAGGADGTIYTASICDVNGNCFTPENLAGDNAANPADGSLGDGMKCPVGEYMVGIANGVAVCENIVEVKCDDPNLPVLRSINADGTLNCVAIPNPTCLADATFVQCGGHATRPTVSLPQAADGWETPNWLVAGDCRSEKYKCNAGAWQLVGGSYDRKLCNDTSPVVGIRNCTDVSGYSGGTYTNTSGTICNTASSSTFSASCMCDESLPANRRTINCAACGSLETLVGTRPTQNQRRICNPGGYSGFAYSGNWRNVDASWIYTGGASTCPATSTYCTCTNGPFVDEWRSVSCPPRHKPALTPLERRYEWNTTTCKMVATSDYRGDACVCDTPGTTSDWRPVNCSNTNKQPAPTPKEREYVWNDTTGVCAFQATSNYRGDECVCKTNLLTDVLTISTCAVPCEEAVNGWIKYNRDPVTCLKDTGSVDSTVAAYCNPLSYYWQDFASSTYSGPTLARKVGDPCSCENDRTKVRKCDLSGIAKKCQCIP